VHICFEGIDGCGGTTQSSFLGRFLTKEGFKVHITQEPSGGKIGQLLREFLKNNKIHPSTDALLFAADRSHHYFNEIKKKIDQGYIVISDRFIESSIVYQSAQSQAISIEWIKQINKFVKMPDITILLDIPPIISLHRKKGELLEKFENIEFLEKVRSLYLERANEENYYIINSNQSLEKVQEKIQTIIMNELNNKFEKPLK
jgi:dTMP kinase